MGGGVAAGGGVGDDEVADVVRLELVLLDPALRGEADRVRELLHPDFVEFGRSGRVWARDDVAAALQLAPEVAGPVVDVVGARLAEDVVLVTYRVTGDRGSLRSSVWVRVRDGRWRMRFHQGTPAPSTA